MGRPINKKFFGTTYGNITGEGGSYSAEGGEGLSSITLTNRGSAYSQGLTATVAVSPIGGTRGEISLAISTANGRVNTATVSTAGTGYTTAPAITLVKPANVVVTGSTTFPANANITVSSTTGLFVGMTANTGFAATETITAIGLYGTNVITMSATNNAAKSTAGISFGDTGASGSLTAVLINVATTANTIQANAWTTNGTIGSQADIVSQRSSRRYRVTNSVETDVVRLVPTGVNGVNSPTVAAVISAGGPTAAGEMTLLATDSDGGVYLVGKLDSRTALVFPAAIGGSAGSQFAANAHVVWTSTGVAEAGVSVKLATND
jgi:hypothetical protein